jgi:hypothetical protein
MTKLDGCLDAAKRMSSATSITFTKKIIEQITAATAG